MTGATRFSISSMIGEARSSPGPKHIIIFAVIYLIFLFAMVFWGRNWEMYKGLFGLWFLAYLVLLYLILRSGMFKKLEEKNPVFILVCLFILGIVLHLPMLLREPSMSRDLLTLERHAELLLNGQFPYRGFDVNKPPLYIWMVGAISLPFGPDKQVFRIFFTLANSLVPVIMFLIHRTGSISLTKLDDESKISGLSKMAWFGGAVGYLLCPILLLETGLGGHFDPVVILTTILSFYFLSRDRSGLSGFMLGTGLALKLYPIFIAPLFFLSFPRWKDRLIFSAGLVMPTLLSTVPLLILDPSLLSEYLVQQFNDRSTGISLMGGLEGILEFAGLPLQISFYFMISVLLFSIVFLSIRGMKGNLKRSDALWVGAGMFLFSCMSVMLSTIYLMNRDSEPFGMILGWIGTVLSILFIVSGLYIFLDPDPSNVPSPESGRSREVITVSIDPKDLPFLTACMLIVLMLASAQFHPWHAGWAIPFLLTSGSSHLTWSALFFLSTFQINGYLPWEI